MAHITEMAWYFVGFSIAISLTGVILTGGLYAVTAIFHDWKEMRKRLG